MIEFWKRWPNENGEVQFLGLSNMLAGVTIGFREIERCGRAGQRLEGVCYDSLECGAVLQRQRKQGAGGAEPALPDILAPSLHFHLPPRALCHRCARSNPGFFCDRA